MAKLKDQTIQGDLLVMGNLTVAGEINDGDLTSIINTSTYGQDRIIRLYPKGVANEQVAINAAIVTIAAAGGGVVHCTQGHWDLNATITMLSGVTLEGEDGTVFDRNHSGNTISANGGGGRLSNVCIRNISFVNTSEPTLDPYVYAINAGWVDGLILRELKFSSLRYCMLIEQDTGVLVRDIIVDHWIAGGPSIAIDCRGSYGYISRVWITGNGVSMSPAVYSGITVNSGNMDISYIYIYNTSSGQFCGIIAAGTVTLSHITIADNVSSSSYSCGISLGYGADHSTLTDITVRNSGTGIRIYTASSYPSYIAIRESFISNAPSGFNGIYIGGGSYHSVLNCKCYNNGSDATIVNTGSNFSDSGTNTQVWGNSWQCIGGVWDVGPTISTDKVQARSSAGLSLFEDGGKGIYVQDSTGYVGIGTASPATRLEVGDSYNQQTIRVSGGSAANKSPVLSILKSGIAEYAWWINTSGTFMLSTNPSGYSDASLSGVSYLAFDNTGNVGIGTTAPSTIMEINKTFASGSEQHDWLRLKGTQGGAWYSGVGLEFYWKDTGNSAEWSHGRIYGIATSFDGAGNGGSCLIFQTKGHGAYANAPTEKMRITSDGRVGIGTASPAGLLDVRKAAEEHFLVRSGSDFGVGYSGIGLDSVNDAAAARKMMILAGDPIVMLGGNVGVKMTPTYTLDVTGNCRISTGFGCNSKTPQTAYSVNAACSDLSTVVALCNQIRTALINNGICA